MVAAGLYGALGLVEVVVVVVVFMVMVVLMSLDRLPSLALVHHHCRQLPGMLPPHHAAPRTQGSLQAPAALLRLLASVLVLLGPERCQSGKEGRAAGQVGGGGHRGHGGDGGGGSRRGLAPWPPGRMAHPCALALGFGGPHKVLAPILGAPESLLEL